MLILSIALFSLAMILGGYLLSHVLKNQNTPKGVALIHGMLAALGLITLISYSLFYSPSPVASIIIFTIVAIGGVILLLMDLTGKSIPKWLAKGHGFGAIIGFIFLLYFTFH